MTYFEFIILMSIVVAFATYLSGRNLKNYKNDPLLAERLFEHQKRLGVIYICIFIGNPSLAPLLRIVGMQVESPDMPMILVLAIDALMIVVLFCVNYFNRRAVLDQTWSLPEALAHTIRFVIAISGFWILLLFAPMIIRDMESLMWPGATAICLLMLVWSNFFTQITPHLLHRSSKIDQETADMFTDIIQQADAVPPEIYAIHSEKGVFFNAFALPSTDKPIILLSRSILKHFNRDELRAVFAHEIAHLEEYTRPRVIKMGLIEKGIILLACFLVPVITLFNTSITSFVPIAWIVFVSFYMFLRNKEQQKSEHRSDIRAAELSGNIDATISCLQKLHIGNLTPRRFELDFEKDATHPSLAKRIRAIRQYFNKIADDDGADTDDSTDMQTLVCDFSPKIKGYNQLLMGKKHLTLIAAEACTDAIEACLTDDQEQIDLRYKNAIKHTRMLYSEIAELRVRIWRKKYTLRIVEKDGNKMDIPLNPDSLQLVQDMLDAVDDQIPNVSKPLTTSLGISKLFSFICGLIVISIMSDLRGSFYMMLAMLILSIWHYLRPTHVSMAAFTGGCFGLVYNMGLMLMDQGSDMLNMILLLGVICFIGFFHVYLLWRKHVDSREMQNVDAFPEKTGIYILLAGMVLLFPHMAVLSSGFDSLLLYSIAASTRCIWFLFFSVGSIFLISRKQYMRYAGCFLVAVAMIPPLLATEIYLKQYTEDCWAARSEKPQIESIPYSSGNIIEVDVYMGPFMVSPNGTYIQFKEAISEKSSTYHMFNHQGRIISYGAVQAVFADENHVMLLTEQKQRGYLLEYKSIDKMETAWRTEIADVHIDWDTHFSVNNGKWRIVSREYYDKLSRWAGTIYDDNTDVTIWKNKENYFVGTGISESDYIITWKVDEKRAGFLRATRFQHFMGAYHDLKNFTFSNNQEEKYIGRSTMYATTFSPLPGYPDMLIQASGNTRSYLWRVNPETFDMKFVGDFENYASLEWNGQWIARAGRQSIDLINPLSGRHYRIDLPPGTDSDFTMALGQSVVAVAMPQYDGKTEKTIVTIIELPAEEGWAGPTKLPEQIIAPQPHGEGVKL